MTSISRNDLPLELANVCVRPADRLGFTMMISALIHLAVILGVGFTYVKREQISQTLEINLATFKSEEMPRQADFLA
ncbi:energy transducer TonB, partial [Pseudomonas syringae pv. tagetis]